MIFKGYKRERERENLGNALLTQQRTLNGNRKHRKIKLNTQTHTSNADQPSNTDERTETNECPPGSIDKVQNRSFITHKSSCLEQVVFSIKQNLDRSQYASADIVIIDS